MLRCVILTNSCYRTYDIPTDVPQKHTTRSVYANIEGFNPTGVAMEDNRDHAGGQSSTSIYANVSGKQESCVGFADSQMAIDYGEIDEQGFDSVFGNHHHDKSDDLTYTVPTKILLTEPATKSTWNA